MSTGINCLISDIKFDIMKILYGNSKEKETLLASTTFFI